MKNSQTYLLVHGAWHGAWCWEYVATALQAKGQNVLTPDLPGRDLDPQYFHTISLQDYVNSLIEVIQQQTQPVTLVGHSMAGLIISVVAEAIPEAIRELVYVAAYVPQGTQSLFSIAQSSQSNNLTPYLMINETEQAISLNLCYDLISIFFNRCNLTDMQKAMARIKSEPLKPLTESINVGTNFSRIAKRSLVSRYDQVLLPIDQLRMSKAVTDNIVYLDADHAAYYSGAKQIIEFLLV
ncbi:alpha/beta hydrolase [Legionella sp. D16C41]|uniref:alpha/beta hydrolase n=1 Tax=Legionella sp. D16C41 TaxID=3402688 RepID=UPI003AF8E23B